MFSEGLIVEAYVVKAGFDIGTQLGLPGKLALELATRPEVLEPAPKIAGDIDAKQAEMIAIVLEQPEVDELPIRSRE